ncbi:hypothetical protein BJY00DRAFT_289100 [Aspergillus carlsbadensis]|nr:hypothetical protein BJY00DRAFT_289100 [Aspergillus carlsbadensis]
MRVYATAACNSVMIVPAGTLFACVAIHARPTSCRKADSSSLSTQGRFHVVSQTRVRHRGQRLYRERKDRCV